MRLWIGLAALTATPATAQTIEPMPAPAADYAAMPTDALARELQGLKEGDPVCSHAFPIFRELAQRRPDLRELAFEARRTELVCANQRLDFATAYGILKSDPAIAGSINGVFALYLTAMARDGAALPAAFERVLRGEDNALEILEPDMLNLALRTARELGVIAAVDTLALDAMRRPETLAKLDPDVRESLAWRALDAAARAGDASGARTLLAELDHPALFDTVLGERMYEAIWPAVEERVGPGYARVTAAFLADRMKRYEAAPDAEHALNDAAHALYYDGRFAEVVALATR